MGIFDFFKTPNESDSEVLSKLFYNLREMLGEMDEKNLIKLSCTAGLFARLASVDFSVSKKEVDFITKALKEFHFLKPSEIEAVVKIAFKNISELCGTENHLYVYPLRDLLTEAEKYNLLLTLFSLAASDGLVDNAESEEIRIISKGLNLSSEHFIAARASVIKQLGALK